TQIEKYKQQINNQKLQFQLNEYEHELNTISLKITELEPSSSSLIEKVNEVQSIKKLYDIEQYIETHKIRRGYVLNQLFSDMEKIHQHLLNYQSLKDVSNRFNKAVEYCQNTLGIQFQLEAAPINHQYSLQEINEFLTELSYAFAKKKVNQENGNRLMKELYVRK
ncbi:DNA helicase, partial [Butyricicoccus sp. 1XD8-22]